MTMHYNALATEGIIRSPITSYSTRDHYVAAEFAENGIGREGGDGGGRRGRHVIYDCLVSVLLMPLAVNAALLDSFMVK